jgi:hypothetical protein
MADLDRMFRNVWFSSHQTDPAVALIIARLRATVAAIGGMIMSERLFFFDSLGTLGPDAGHGTRRALREGAGEAA